MSNRQWTKCAWFFFYSCILFCCCCRLLCLSLSCWAGLGFLADRSFCVCVWVRVYRFLFAIFRCILAVSARREFVVKSKIIIIIIIKKERIKSRDHMQSVCFYLQTICINIYWRRKDFFSLFPSLFWRMCGVVCVCVCLYVRSAPSAGSTIGGEAVAKQLCPCGWQMDEANSDDNAMDATLLYDTKVRSGEYCAVLCFVGLTTATAAAAAVGTLWAFVWSPRHVYAIALLLGRIMQTQNKNRRDILKWICTLLWCALAQLVHLWSSYGRFHLYYILQANNNIIFDIAILLRILYDNGPGMRQTTTTKQQQQYGYKIRNNMRCGE